MTNQPTTRTGATFLALAAFALAGLMLFGGLGSLPLMQPDEGRNAEVAREMYASGSWLVPTLEGNAYLDKPAFFFKCSALCFSAFGVSEASARLPSALFGFGVVVLAFLFCRRASGSRAAAIAVAAVSTAPMFVVFSRLVIMDMTLAFFVVAAIFCGAIAAEYEGRRGLFWMSLGAAMAGLATAVKGPVGFILPILVLAIWHFSGGRPRAVLRIFHPLPLAIFWAVALAWLVPLCRARPDFLHYGLVEETVKRVTTNSTHRAQPFYFYGLVVPAGLFAWSLMMPEAAFAVWRDRKKLAPMDRLCIVWLIAVTVFFSLSKTKQPGYVLTVAVPAGLLVARLFDMAWRDPKGRAANIVRHTVFIVASVLLVLAAGLISLPSDVIGKMVHAAPVTMSLMRPMLGPVIIAMVVLGLVGFVSALRRSVAVSFVFFAALMPALVVPNLHAITAYSENRSCRELVRALPQIPRETDFVCLSLLPPALPFYLQRTVTFIDSDFGELGSNYILYTLRQTNAVTRNLVREEDRERWFAAQTNAMFVLTSQKNRRELAPWAAARGVVIKDLPERMCGALFPKP